MDHIDLGALNVAAEVVPRLLAYRDSNISHLISLDEVSRVEYGKLPVRVRSYNLCLICCLYFGATLFTLGKKLQRRGLLDLADATTNNMRDQPRRSTAGCSEGDAKVRLQLNTVQLC